jgi:hypothetical protein
VAAGRFLFSQEDTMTVRTAAQLKAEFQETDPQDNQDNLADTIYQTAAKAVSIPLNALRVQAAAKDALPDAPNATALGLADAAGSLLTGTQTNNTSASEVAAFTFALPEKYVDGEAVTVRVRAKVSAARQVSATVDVVAKKQGDTGLGSDICATAAQNLTTSYVNYDFTITPTGLVAGDVLWIEVYLATNDTGGSTNGTPTASAISVRPVCYL